MTTTPGLGRYLKKLKRKMQVEDPRGLEKGEYDGPTDPREKTKNKKIMQKYQLKYKSGGAVLKGKKVGCQIK